MDRSFGSFRFFGNTVSSDRVNLRSAISEHSHSVSTGGGGSGGGCAGVIGGGGWKGDACRGRDATFCRIEFEKACEVCLHTRQPLKNLKIFFSDVTED